MAGMVPCAEAPLPRICFEFIHPPRSSLINHSKARQVGVPKHAIVYTAPGYVSIIRLPLSQNSKMDTHGSVRTEPTHGATKITTIRCLSYITPQST